jgi:hypothetical protein
MYKLDYQNAGKNHKIRATGSFKNAEQLKYFIRIVATSIIPGYQTTEHYITDYSNSI